MKAFAYSLVVLLLLSGMVCTASAAVDYNDPNVAKEVNRLRKFRDFHLKKYEAGRKFIDFYYTYGPTAADAIRKRERLKSMVRLSLLPLMYTGRNFDAVLWGIKILAGFLAFTLVWWFGRLFTRKGDKRRPSLHTYFR